MPKPWARYEVNFINHDKFRALPSNAICLWIEGKNYADDKLTDGLLPTYEIKHWRFFSKKNMELLTTSVGVKPGTTEPYAPLWEVVKDFGFKMHDYLTHNECRDKVLARLKKSDDEKARKKANQQAWRDRQNVVADAVTEPVTERSHVTALPDKQNSELRTQNKQEQETDPACERFLLAFPKRESRKEVIAWWQAIRPNADFAAVIVAGAERYARMVGGVKPRYIKNPANWLNEARWEDGAPTPVLQPFGPRVEWTCPHEPKCSHYTPCSIKTALEQARAEKVRAS